MSLELIEKTCVSCGLCQKNCEFLKKYNLDFSKKQELKALSYHCLLCGACTRVCSKGVDGKEIILKMRQQKVKETNGKIKGYSQLKFEKINYKFKNYKRANSKSVIFFGCSYPSNYPEATKKLENLMNDFGIGSIFDCCGKPISELGLEEKAENIIKKLDLRLKKHGIEELIAVCPNCYYFIRDKLSVPVVSIYEKLSELDIKLDKSLFQKEINIFLPCPDKAEKLWLNHIKELLPCEIHEIKEAQCCGLGGVALAKEPDYRMEMADKLKGEYDDIYVYCASCGSSFYGNGLENTHHILNVLIGENQKPDIKSSFKNRLKFKFY